MLSIVGWHDNFLKSHFDLYRALAAAGAAPARRAARGSTRTTSRRSRRAARARVEFGPDGGLAASRSRRRSCSDWFDRWLTGDGARRRGRRPLLAARRGRVARGRELAAAAHAEQRWYLHSGGGANSADGDGLLSQAAPRATSRRRVSCYDPLDPVPTVRRQDADADDHDRRHRGSDRGRGAARRPLLHLAAADGRRRRARARRGSSSGQRPPRSTPTSPPSSSTSLPDGHAINLADGIVRARYRESPRRRSAAARAGRADACFSIDLWDLAHTFLPGHRLRLEISSSNFPRFDRNPNTGNEIGVDGPGDVADRRRSSVFHDAEPPERARAARRGRLAGGERHRRGALDRARAVGPVEPDLAVGEAPAVARCERR